MNWLLMLRKNRREKRSKKAKDFAKADVIREELLAKGIVLKDTREGTFWENSDRKGWMI